MDSVLSVIRSYPVVAVAAVFSGVALLWVLVSRWTGDVYCKALPFVGLPEEGLSLRDSWNQQGPKVQAKGLREYNGPFNIMTGQGAKTILPNTFAKELQKHPDASFVQHLNFDFFGGWRGFEGVSFVSAHEKVFIDTVHDLTRSLALVTDSMADEARLAVPSSFGECTEWQTILLKPKTGLLIAQLLSRVMLGTELCRDPEWLTIARDYTTNVAVGSMSLRGSSKALRPLMYWFNPQCTRLRQHARDANRLIAPVVQKRRERARKLLEAGEKPDKVADSIGWMTIHAQGRDIDYASGQLGMAFAGIHNTTETLAAAIIDLCNNPEALKPMREEVIAVVTEHGWSRESLNKLRLVDSFLKESQRCHPALGAAMGRMALKDVTLSTGLVIPKGARFGVVCPFMDPEVYPEPEKFDAYRFLKLRDAATGSGPASEYLHASMSAEHMGFGFGSHGCPGRALASNELKIALGFMLLQYDWRLEEGPTFRTFAVANSVDARCRVSYRKRESEIEL
ncbi:hypothetical protein LTS10_002875 [Elasticomyces elasticus]|nr:hypothetical protein LTS10_002875 [Elasticomyces elasticus]